MDDTMPPSTLLLPVIDASTNWSRLFTEMCELFHATVQVVSIRTTRMAIAGPVPDEQDRREFSLMSREKGEAASESIRAMSSGLMDLGMVLARNTSNHVWATSAAATTLARSRSATQWFEHQAELLRVASDCPVNPLQMFSSATCLMQDILTPIHGRATANAKRLGAP